MPTTRPPKNPSKPERPRTEAGAVDAYLASIPTDHARALADLRARILSAAPGMQERLSRGVPFWYHRGKRAVGFRSSKPHLSFFIMEGRVMRDLHHRFTDLDHSSTVIRFTPTSPLPAGLVEELVRARIHEIESP